MNYRHCYSSPEGYAEREAASEYADREFGSDWQTAEQYGIRYVDIADDDNDDWELAYGMWAEETFDPDYPLGR